MKKIIISLLCICMMTCFSVPVLANDEIIGEKNIETLLISPEGELYVEYADDDLSLSKSTSDKVFRAD